MLVQVIMKKFTKALSDAFFSLTKKPSEQAWKPKNMGGFMIYPRYFLLVALAVLLLAACSPNKPVIEEKPVEPTTMELARKAAGQGNDLYEEKQYTMAIEAFQKAIDKFNQAQTEGSATETDSIAINVEAMNLNIAKAYSDLALESATDSMFDEAAGFYKKSLEVYQTMIRQRTTEKELQDYIYALYSNISYTLTQATKYEDAISYLDLMLSIQPNNEETLNLKFSILRDNIKDEERAFSVLKDYAEAAQDANAFMMLAEKYVDKKNDAQAVIYYEKALALKDDENVILRVAQFYRNGKQWDKSTALYDRYIAKKPDQASLATAYKLVGDNYRQAKNTTKMVEYFDKYLAIERDAQIALLLASHFNSQKNYQRVISYASTVLSVDSRNSDALMLRGVAYYQLKRNAEAKSDLEKLQNDPKYGAQATQIIKAIK